MEKQQTIEKQPPPPPQALIEKQQSSKPSTSRLVVEKKRSFRGVTTKKHLSGRGMMDKKKSFRWLIEKQRCFPVVMERQRKKNRESPGKRGDSPLNLAARIGNLSRVKEILHNSDGANAKELSAKHNVEGETPLYVAAEKGQALVVAEMLKNMDVETATITARNGYDSFHVAAKQDHVEVLKELLDTFPNLIMTTDLANTNALHTAALQGHIDVVNLLQQTDSNLAKIARNNGKTARHSAARMGHLQLVKSLLTKDPSIGFRIEKKGQTALQIAVKCQNEEIVLELLKPDLSVLGLEDSKGNTSLHIAIKKGHAQIVRCLLSIEGININKTNKAGESPLDIAEKFVTPEVVSILKEAGATNSKDHATKQLKQTASDIKLDVQSQLQQARQTGFRVKKFVRTLKNFHISGLNNAINSTTVVAVLIATVVFAAIFTVPGQYVDDKTEEGFSLGEAYIANRALFFVFDSLTLFISLAVVVVQTSLVAIEQKAKKELVFVINKLMWLTGVFISVAFVSLTYVVVGEQSRWLAVCATVVGSLIVLSTIGSTCFCVVLHRMEESKGV